MPVALVTGATRGIGLELCRELSARGYDVLMGCRDLSKAVPVPHSQPLLLDVSSERSIKSAAEALREWRIDLLVNNAAEPDWIPNGPSIGALDITPEKWLSVFRANVLGPILMVQHFLPMLGARARVINIGSGVAGLNHPHACRDFQIAYAASKSALWMTTLKLAAALEPYGISCKLVDPGWCRTEMGGMDAPRSASDGAEEILRVAIQ